MHIVYSDKSSLILHPKGDCFTYFWRNGKKQRQLLKYAINHSMKSDGDPGPLDKLLLGLNLYNTYSDIPNLGRPEVVNEQLVVQKFNKVTKATWPGQDNIDEYSWIDEQGNMHLKSVDKDVCEITLSSNMLHFKVQYLHLLPTKKHQWVGVDNGMSMNGDFNEAGSVSAYSANMS